jgi:hypothetical protein
MVHAHPYCPLPLSKPSSLHPSHCFGQTQLAKAWSLDELPVMRGIQAVAEWPFGVEFLNQTGASSQVW